MTSVQRLRLVLALGTVNLLLVTVVLGFELTGALPPDQGTVLATASSPIAEITRPEPTKNTVTGRPVPSSGPSSRPGSIETLPPDVTPEVSPSAATTPEPTPAPTGPVEPLVALVDAATPTPADAGRPPETGRPPDTGRPAPTDRPVASHPVPSPSGKPAAVPCDRRGVGSPAHKPPSCRPKPHPKPTPHPTPKPTPHPTPKPTPHAAPLPTATPALARQPATDPAPSRVVRDPVPDLGPATVAGPRTSPKSARRLRTSGAAR